MGEGYIEQSCYQVNSQLSIVISINLKVFRLYLDTPKVIDEGQT